MNCVYNRSELNESARRALIFRFTFFAIMKRKATSGLVPGDIDDIPNKVVKLETKIFAKVRIWPVCNTDAY